MSHAISLFGYTIAIEPGLLERVGEESRRAAPAHRFAIITDDVVAPHYLSRVARSLTNDDGAPPPTAVTIPAGEEHKTREQWSRATDALLEAGYGRDTTVIALGGGVVGDLAGFVAATFMRGVPFVQVPTTLLAMVDASVGGKTGVDTPAGKNLVGAFHQPAAVLIDPLVLRTLAPRHLRAGLAEVVKHGIIADACHLEAAVRDGGALINGTLEPARAAELVARSVSIKADVVRRDEREGGERRVLNFGHTIAHAIERATEYAVLHGEAVAIGLVVEARIAERLGVAAPGTTDAVEQAVATLELPTALPAGLASDVVLDATRTDKKGRAGRVEYALPRRIGQMEPFGGRWSTPVDDALVLACLAR